MNFLLPLSEQIITIRQWQKNKVTIVTLKKYIYSSPSCVTFSSSILIVDIEITMMNTLNSRVIKWLIIILRNLFIFYQIY